MISKEKLKSKIHLSIHGCIKAVNNGAGSTTEKFDWTSAFADAAILAGLAFFGALAGTAILGVPTQTAVVSAGITAGFQFFIILALKRGLTYPTK